MRQSTFLSSRGEFTQFGCIYYDIPLFKKYEIPYILNMHINDVAISEYHIFLFGRVMRMWGFPVEIVKNDDIYKVIFTPEKFKNNDHFLAAFTMARYMLVCEAVFTYSSFETEDVIPQTFLYKKKYKHLDLFQCFQLAHYKCMSGEHDEDHSCFKEVSKLVSFAYLKEKMKANYYSVNSLFWAEDNELSDSYYWNHMYELINKDEEAAIKKLM